MCVTYLWSSLILRLSSCQKMFSPGNKEFFLIFFKLCIFSCILALNYLFLGTHYESCWFTTDTSELLHSLCLINYPGHRKVPALVVTVAFTALTLCLGFCATLLLSSLHGFPLALLWLAFKSALHLLDLAKLSSMWSFSGITNLSTCIYYSSE